MRVVLSWLRTYVDVPASVSTDELAERLTMIGLKHEVVERPGSDVTGPVVLGRVLSVEPEEHSNGKTINWCRVDVGPEHNDAEGGRGIVCGADNFGPGDLVVVALPGAELTGGFAISARKTYGHISDGMICSATELGLPDDGSGGIIVLDPDTGAPGDNPRAALFLDDEVIELEVTPDRGYGLSMRGVARDAALASGGAYRDPAHLDVPEADDRGYPVRVDDPSGCPVFATRVVEGIDPSRPTPAWMARRLQLAGMRPLSLAIDITNYVMLELGQPIHGYDRDALRGALGVRRATAGEKLTTLDDVERTLDASDLVITDDRGPIGLAGVMGGQTTELSAQTTAVVIECANFDATSISRTARRHRLPSEASRRFERGVDPAVCAQAAQRVVDLLVELAGGTAVEGSTVVGEAPRPLPITLDAGLPARVTGLEVSADGAIQALESVGCAVDRTGDALVVTPPSYRPDLLAPYDLVEEVTRVVGYDRIPSILPVAPAGGGLTTTQQLRRRLGWAMSGSGLHEVKSYPFVGDATFDALQLPADDTRRRAIRMANPLAETDPFLTTTLLPGLLRSLARNASRGSRDVGLFELAPVFHPDERPADAPILSVERRPSAEEQAALYGAVPSQPWHLAAVIAGSRSPAGWWGAARQATWADAVAVACEAARVSHVDLEREAASLAPWHPGRCAALLIDGEVVGHAGELHPKVCRAFGVPERSVAVELNVDALTAASPEAVQGSVVSRYPVAKEDLALVVPDGVASADVAEALRAGGGPLVESVRLFDAYAGEQVAEGRRSLTFALRLRADDRTLTDDDIRATREAALAEAERRVGATLRT